MAAASEGFMDDLSNSVVPTTIGGMLAEEWTIDPFSSMPSFLERLFMQEAHDSYHKALETAYDTIVDYAERFILSLARQRAEIFALQSSSGSSRFDDLKRHFLDKSREVIQRLLRVVASTMRRYRLAIIGLCIYTIERASLEKSNCLLAESFYGGYRVRLNPAAKNGKARSTSALDTKDKVRLAGLVALSIFVKGKLEQLFQHLKRNEHIMLTDNKKKLFVKIFPWIRSCFQSVSFLSKWNYLLGHSPFFDVPSLLLQQWLRRVSKEDYPISSPPASSTGSADGPDNNKEVNLMQTASTATTLCLAFSWITWCRSKWMQLSREQDKADVIPPPPPPPPTTLMAAKAGRCVLCGALPPEKPTACTVSGFVGCAACVQDYLARNSQCPVTKRACTAESWVRLYEPRS